MLNSILGEKMNMGQSYIDGTRVAFTKVKAGPCVVTAIKKEDKDGYWGVQVGFGKKRIKKVTKPLKGHLKSVISGKYAPRFLTEFRTDIKPEFRVGDEIEVTKVFKKGDLVAVSGISKGKGFAGVMKRWNFKGGPRTHGQSDRERAPGSIGQGTTPGRVHKGKKMAGRMGNRKFTIKNLFVLDIDQESGEILISGPVPGSKGGLLTITKIGTGKLEDLVKEEVQQVQVTEEESEEEKEVSNQGQKEEKQEKSEGENKEGESEK